jgi:competence protein ComEC
VAQGLAPALIAFALGVCAAQQQATLFAAPGVWTLGIACAAVWFRARMQGVARNTGLALTIILAGAFGLSYASWRADVRLTEALPAALEGEPLTLVGVIASLPSVDDRGTRFTFEVERVDAPLGAPIPSRLSLGWFAGPLKDEVPALRVGERWRLAVRLKRPHGFSNPNGFDVEAWLLENGIRATGAVSSGPTDTVNQRLTRNAGRWSDRVEQWRERIRARIEAAMPDGRWTGVLVALAIGDQRSIRPADWDVFNRTGISHLLSISGAHVTLFAALCAALTAGLWRRSYRLGLIAPARKAAAVAAFVTAGGYALLAGFAVPAQRTFYMLTIAAIGLWIGKSGSAWTVLAWALAVVLLIDPWAVLSAGFWFSFCAVAVLFFLSAYRVGSQTWWQRALAAQGVITFALAPIALALFQMVSVIGLLTNIVAVPLISFVVVPLVLAWIVVPWDALLHLAHAAMAMLSVGLTWAQAQPYALWQQHAPPLWTVVLAMIGALWLIAPRGVPARGLAVVWILPLLTVKPARPEPGNFTLTALDVGQGLALVVQTHSYDLLYDTGPRWDDDSDAGHRIVVPYLRASGARMGAVVVSHADTDHSGGAASVLGERPPDWWMSSLPDGAPLRARTALPHLRCVTGQRWTWDAVHFEVVHPTLDNYVQTRKPNDNSCVIRVQAQGGESALLTGDAEALSESEMITRKLPLRADVLTTPHHGSRTSSTSDFIAAVQPTITVVNAGYRNRFGHPRPDVLARYQAAQVRIDRTDWHGAVHYAFKKDSGWSVQRWRDVHRRYWHNQPDVMRGGPG